MRMKDNKRKAAYKAKRPYLLSGLIECASCGATYVGSASRNTKGYETRYYICGDKKRTKSCNAKNINADIIEAFVVQGLKQYLMDSDFESVARKIAEKVNNTSPDLSAEKAELVDITRKINNGMKAILGGMDFAELEEEIDRLRMRKNELEDIIIIKGREVNTVDSGRIVALFESAINTWSPETLPEIVRNHVTKIYAHADGAFTVHVGVHTDSCGSARCLVSATLDYVLDEG